MGAIVLDNDAHAPIIRDYQRVCAIAGIHPNYLRESMVEHCTKPEVDWVRYFKQYKLDGLPGMVLEGLPHPERRCQAIAGALLRNYIDGRVMTVASVLRLNKGGDVTAPHVLLIPNFYVTTTARGDMAPWDIAALYDILINRTASGRPTVVYVEDWKDMAAHFGKVFAEHLSTYRVVTPHDQ